MSWTRSLIDTALIARFELLRAIRSWTALAVILMYLIANVGGAYVFIRVLGQLENTMAEQLHVATTHWPGAMTDQLRKSKQLMEMFDTFVGNHTTAATLIERPFLAVYQLWQGIVLIPFLAATAAAESIAADVRTRAIRFEVIRTGRAEVVAGRFLGQLGLCVVATCIALCGVWVLGLSIMAPQDPVALAWGLVELGMRAVLFAVPFSGLGIAASQLTASPAWARVLALGGTAASWVIYWILSALEDGSWATLSDALLPVMPQSWLQGLWQSDLGLVVSTGALAGLGVVVAALGFARFVRRDL